MSMFSKTMLNKIQGEDSVLVFLEQFWLINSGSQESNVWLERDAFCYNSGNFRRYK